MAIFLKRVNLLLARSLNGMNRIAVDLVESGSLREIHQGKDNLHRRGPENPGPRPITSSRGVKSSFDSFA